MQLACMLLLTLAGVSLGCQHGSDCAADECCIIMDDGSLQCQKFLRYGAVCHVLSGRDPFVKPDFPVKECICQPGSMCVPDDPSRPLGAKGTCQMFLVS